MSQREYFTEAEARALVGRTVRTTIEFSGVPAGTSATITRADPNAQGKGWTVALTWDMPHDPHQVDQGEIEGEPFLVITGGTPLTDWFARDEYMRWIAEIAVGDGDRG